MEREENAHDSSELPVYRVTRPIPWTIMSVFRFTLTLARVTLQISKTIVPEKDCNVIF